MTITPTDAVSVVVWEITTEDQHGHRTVHRVRATTAEEAEAALNLADAPAPVVIGQRPL